MCCRGYRQNSPTIPEGRREHGTGTGFALVGQSLSLTVGACGRSVPLGAAQLFTSACPPLGALRRVRPTGHAEVRDEPDIQSDAMYMDVIEPISISIVSCGGEPGAYVDSRVKAASVTLSSRPAARCSSHPPREPRLSGDDQPHIKHGGR
jgi:hypothetical protein